MFNKNKKDKNNIEPLSNLESIELDSDFDKTTHPK